MAIKTVTMHPPATTTPIIFRDSALAHKYLDGLNGIEIGAAAHNPFNLEGCKAVGLKDLDRTDHDFFAREQLAMCNAFVDIDIDAEADMLPIEDDSLDYVVTSHVIEHLPNPIRAFAEWDRVLHVGGYIFMIVPKRNALPADSLRGVSSAETFVKAYRENWSADSVPNEYMRSVPGGRRGHYWVFTLEELLTLLDLLQFKADIHWEVVEALETDDKVGNGHCVLLRKKAKDAAS